MMEDSLIVTLDGPRFDEAGVLVDDFARVLTGVSQATRLMVSHLAGYEPRSGQMPTWIREHSRLRLSPTRPGSFVAELTSEFPADTQMSLENLGQQAISALSSWNGEDSILPRPVTDCLYRTASILSRDTRLWLGSVSEPRNLEVKRLDENTIAAFEVEAVLQGWLKEINWDKGKAQLHSYSGGYVPLRFDPSLSGEMLRLATKYIEVRGSGSFDRNGDWKTVKVTELKDARSLSEPVDANAFPSASGTKVYDPAQGVRIDLTDEEWESFDSAIRKGRED